VSSFQKQQETEYIISLLGSLSTTDKLQYAKEESKVVRKRGRSWKKKISETRNYMVVE